MSYYKSKITAVATLTGPSKGRTLKAMRQRADKLIGSGSTRSDGLMLLQLHKVLEACHELRLLCGRVHQQHHRSTAVAQYGNSSGLAVVFAGSHS